MLGFYGISAIFRKKYANKKHQQSLVDDAYDFVEAVVAVLVKP